MVGVEVAHADAPVYMQAKARRGWRVRGFTRLHVTRRVAKSTCMTRG